MMNNWICRAFDWPCKAPKTILLVVLIVNDNVMMAMHPAICYASTTEMQTMKLQLHE